MELLILQEHNWGASFNCDVQGGHGDVPVCSVSCPRWQGSTHQLSPDSGQGSAAALSQGMASGSLGSLGQPAMWHMLMIDSCLMPDKY